jgi:hypothetical protein
MSDEREERDERLARLLRCWGPPAVPEGLDERVLAAYRRRTLPLWRRLLKAEVRVPLPVAAAVLLLLVLSAVFALRPAPAGGTAAAPASASSGPVQTARRPDPAVVSRTSFVGFEPVDEMQATVVTERTP